MNKGMSLDEYMVHTGSGGGGKRNYLKQWKKNPGYTTVWLSTRASIYTLWRHNFQKVEVREDKETKEKAAEVWQNRLVCWEDGADLSDRKRFFRDKQSGELDYPPKVCPFCKMIDDVYMRVHRGELSITTPLFKFDGKVKDMETGRTVADHMLLHAGGFFNAFQKDKLTDAQKKEMADLPKSKGGPLFLNSAWRQNATPKLEYVYIVASNDDPAAGLSIAVEPQLLGQKMQSEIAKMMKRKGQEGGHPLLAPYAFRWDKNPDQNVSFDKLYDVTALDNVVLKPAVEKLIRDVAPPDVGPLLEKFNLKSLRAQLERHALVQLPWDEYFETAFKVDAAERERQKNAPTEPAPEAGGRTPRVTAPSRPAANPGIRSEPIATSHVAPPPPAAPEVFGCDNCEQEMLATDTVCKHCGTSYEVESAPAPPPPPPPKPPLPKRSEAAAAPAAGRSPRAATPAPAPAAPSLGAMAPAPADEEDVYPGDAGDDIPFISNTLLTDMEPPVQYDYEVPTRFLPRV